MKPSSPWVQLVDQTGIAQNAYRRPLGLTELAFYWDHVFNGTATTIQDIHVEVTAGSEETLSEKAVERAWARLKQTFPLIGAQLDEHPDEVGVDFVVREENLQSVRYGELRFESAGSSDEVQAVVEHLMNGPTTLTNDKIAELWVIRRKDAPRQFHLLLVVAHVITDGMAGATLMRHLCQELSLPSVDPVPALWERLQVVPALENLYPSASMSAPRRRWRQAIGRVIYNIRNAKLQVRFLDRLRNNQNLNICIFPGRPHASPKGLEHWVKPPCSLPYGPHRTSRVNILGNTGYMSETWYHFRKRISCALPDRTFSSSASLTVSEGRNRRFGMDL